MDCSHVFEFKLNRLIIVLALFIAPFLIVSPSFAQADSAIVGSDSAALAVGVSAAPVADGHKKKVEPTKIIMEHIADSHMWHLWGHTSLPLPVIVYTSAGLDVFSSGHFHHGEHDYTSAKHTYRLVNDKVKIVGADGQVDEAATAKLLDFSITKNVTAMFISIAIILVIFISVAGAYKKRVGKAPKGLQSFVEPIIVFVRDEIAKPNVGHKYAKFMPYLLTVFFFIWINNLLGLVPIFPGSANVTGNISLTLVLSLGTLLLVNLNGNKYYWKHILTPDVPWWLYPIMIPVELIGVISKPFALMIRLFANITAGHIIVLSLISLIFIFESLAIAPVSVAFVLFMLVLELLVAFLQAFIFTLLTALFIGMAVEEHH